MLLCALPRSMALLYISVFVFCQYFLQARIEGFPLVRSMLEAKLGRHQAVLDKFLGVRNQARHDLEATIACAAAGVVKEGWRAFRVRTAIVRFPAGISLRTYRAAMLEKHLVVGVSWEYLGKMECCEFQLANLHSVA